MKLTIYKRIKAKSILIQEQNKFTYLIYEKNKKN